MLLPNESLNNINSFFVFVFGLSIVIIDVGPDKYKLYLSAEDYYRTDIHWKQENIRKAVRKIVYYYLFVYIFQN